MEDLASSRRARGERLPAYPALVDGNEGVWDMAQLYVNREWKADACALAPRTAALLKPLLPSSEIPYIHYNTEEVVFLLLAPDSRVRLHNGGSNVPINVSLGLTGCGGAFLEGVVD